MRGDLGGHASSQVQRGTMTPPPPVSDSKVCESQIIEDVMVYYIFDITSQSLFLENSMELTHRVGTQIVAHRTKWFGRWGDDKCWK